MAANNLFQISIDNVILSYLDNSIKLLVVKKHEEPYQNTWGLVGNIIKPSIDVDISVENTLYNIFGRVPYHRQVQFFGNVDRHPNGHIPTLCYYSLVSFEDIQNLNIDTEYKWLEINSLPNLAYDHSNLLKVSLNRFKEQVLSKPIAFELLPKLFKIPDLTNIYDQILGTELDRRNFSRKLKRLDVLGLSGLKEQKASHRPAQLYYFDEQKYELNIGSNPFQII